MQVPADQALKVWRTQARTILEQAAGYPVAEVEPWLTEGAKYIQFLRAAHSGAPYMDLIEIAHAVFRAMSKPEPAPLPPQAVADHESWGAW
jgi:hypothetical protein